MGSDWRLPRSVYQPPLSLISLPTKTESLVQLAIILARRLYTLPLSHLLRLPEYWQQIHGSGYVNYVFPFLSRHRSEYLPQQSFLVDLLLAIPTDTTNKGRELGGCRAWSVSLVILHTVPYRTPDFASVWDKRRHMATKSLGSIRSLLSTISTNRKIVGTF